MVPAHERFDADTPAGCRLDLGLVVDDQLSTVDRLAELMCEREFAPHVGLASTHVHLEARAARLGLAHRRIGTTQQAFGVERVVGRHGDTDRHSGFEVQPVDGETRRHGGDELLAELTQIAERDPE